MTRLAHRRLGTIVQRTLDQVAISCDDNSVRVYGPYPPSPGRERWRLVVVNGSVRKAVTAGSAQAAALLKESLEKEVERHGDVTLGEAIADYLAYKKGVSSAVWLSTLERRLVGFFPSDLHLSAVTREYAQQLYDAETTRLTPRGNVISATTHQHLLRNVKEFFAWLVKRGRCAANPFAEVEPVGKARRGKPQLKETEALKLDQLLFDEANNGNEGALALLVQVYGALRSSEVLRLQVGDIEVLPNGKCRTHINSFAQGDVGKNANARRSVDLDGCLTDLLRAACENRPATSRLFAAHLPKVPAPDYLYKRLKAFCKKAGIPDYCPHSLRGYHASAALEAGVSSSTVAKTLGHSNFDVTKRHYATASSVHNAKALRVAEALQAGKAPKLTPEQKAELRRFLDSET